MSEDIPEVPVGYDDLLGCYIICPHCMTMQVFTNTLPDVIEECLKCQGKMKPMFR